jgi:hypothetical protein
MPDESPAPSTEPPSDEQRRLNDFLEYRARAAQSRRRMGRTRVAAWTLACTVALLAVIVLAARAFRHEAAAPNREAVGLPSIMAAARGPADESAPEPSAAPQQFAPASEPRAPTPSPAQTPPAAPDAKAPQPPARVIAEPQERLGVLAPGDTKERVFELFATTVQRQGKAVVWFEGIRLRARAHSPRHRAMEVADVQLRDGVHWFLFADERLVAWGRLHDWCAAAARHHVEVDYPAAPCPAVSGTD